MSFRKDSKEKSVQTKANAADSSEDLLSFAEEKAELLMKCHLEDMAIIRNEANITFTFVAAVLSGAFGYLINLYTSLVSGTGDWQWFVPVLVLNVHLMLCAIVIVQDTMRLRDVQLLGNEPKNILSDSAKKMSATEVRLHECMNQQERIEKNRERNLIAARALNNVRTALVATPVVVTAAWAISALLTH